MRLMSPVSTLPGPTSTNFFTPMATIRSTDSTQRTGEATCRSRALRTAVALPIGEASTFDTSGTRRSRTFASSSSGARRSAAGAISSQWKGAETGSGTARRTPRVLATAMARSIPSFVPAMTICPGALMFATETISPCAASSQMARASSTLGPISAAMPPLPTGTASCMNRPRARTSLAASAGVRPPAPTMALYSPSECPATRSCRAAPCSSSTA